MSLSWRGLENRRILISYPQSPTPDFTKGSHQVVEHVSLVVLRMDRIKSRWIVSIHDTFMEACHTWVIYSEYTSIYLLQL